MTTLLLMVTYNKKRLLMGLVSAALGVVMALTEVLCCWAGSNTDSSTDQSSLTEAHLAAVDNQVPHTANIGLSGGNAPWEEKICKEGQL